MFGLNLRSGPRVSAAQAGARHLFEVVVADAAGAMQPKDERICARLVITERNVESIGHVLVCSGLEAIHRFLSEEKKQRNPHHADIIFARRVMITSSREASMKTRLTWMAAALLIAASAMAQNAQDFSKVEIKTTTISDKFYTLEGQGGMIGALVGPDGVFLVDTQFAPLSDKIVAAVKKITNSPIKFVVNTHVH